MDDWTDISDSEDGNADHDGMKREAERQISDDPDCHRDHVVAKAADRDRRRPGIGTMFQRDSIEYRPTQERAEQDDAADIAVGEQMRRRPQLDARQHRM